MKRAKEWDYSPVREWNEVQRLLDERSLKTLNTMRSFGQWEGSCDVMVDFEFHPYRDVIPLRLMSEFLNLAERIGQRCEPALRDKWNRVFFQTNNTSDSPNTETDDSACLARYPTQVRELRVPDDLSDDDAFYWLGAALSPNTVQQLAQWTREVDIEAYRSTFRASDDYQEWDDFAQSVRFWFEVLRRTSLCNGGLLTFAA